jgi:hypothetical protein
MPLVGIVAQEASGLDYVSIGLRIAFMGVMLWYLVMYAIPGEWMNTPSCSASDAVPNRRADLPVALSNVFASRAGQ